MSTPDFTTLWNGSTEKVRGLLLRLEALRSGGALIDLSGIERDLIRHALTAALARKWKPGDPRCDGCDNGLEPDWVRCPFCEAPSRDNITEPVGEEQLLAQAEGLAIGLEQRGEKSAAHCVRRLIALLAPDNITIIATTESERG